VSIAFDSVALTLGNNGPGACPRQQRVATVCSPKPRRAGPASTPCSFLLRDYIAYHHNDRTHLELAKATPTGRPRQTRPVGDAEIIALPRLGDLHHRYEWRGPRRPKHLAPPSHPGTPTINLGYLLPTDPA
jgi:hypothetical protein